LVNYCLKLGWTPLFVDIDLANNMLSAPGCMSAALIEDMLDGHSDSLTAKSINYFHGACNPGNFIITPDFFDTQIKQLASACESKQLHDITQFKTDN